MTALWRKRKPAQSSSAPTPEVRIWNFLEDYCKVHSDATPLLANEETFAVFFSQWKKMVQPVMRRHFTDDCPVDLAESFGRFPAYGPLYSFDDHSVWEPWARAYVPSSEDSDDDGHYADGDIIYVVYRTRKGVSWRLEEYVVEARNGDFKISNINVYTQDPGVPFVSAATIAERQQGCAPDAPLLELPEVETRLDHNLNFTPREGRYPYEDNEVDDGNYYSAHLSRVDNFTTRSGVLSVLDFGHPNDAARPLARTVPPGTYPTERIVFVGRTDPGSSGREEGYNAAVRVRFSEETPVSWWRATPVGSENHIVDVDTGSICIVDYPDYAGMTPREKAAAFSVFAQPYAQSPRGIRIPLTEPEFGIACDSGEGDGSYPAYWGLDSDGQVAQLVVDFFVLVQGAEDYGHYWHIGEDDC